MAGALSFYRPGPRVGGGLITWQGGDIGADGSPQGNWVETALTGLTCFVEYKDKYLGSEQVLHGHSEVRDCLTLKHRSF